MIKERTNYPQVPLSRTFGHYQIKTATTQAELQSCFKLRHEVFYREFAGIQTADDPLALDMDEHDALCDHLLIKDLRSDEVVACYRLLASPFKHASDIFYSQTEFKIDEFINNGEAKLELGRACVHKDYRRGTVILLLWRGLIEYAKLTDVRYLFGCSSITHDQFPYLPEIMAEIEAQDKLIKDWPVGVRDKYVCDLANLEISSATKTKAHTSLMQIYLNAGARVAGSLALDREFNCVDLFTILDLHDLPPAFRKSLSD